MNTNTAAPAAHVCDRRTDGAGSAYYVSRDACPACASPRTIVDDVLDERVDLTGFTSFGILHVVKVLTHRIHTATNEGDREHEEFLREMRARAEKELLARAEKGHGR